MTAPKRIHLVCNAHLDPVYMWQWEDGFTEAFSTFRIACEFCERVKGFVFCHNESLLYKWVQDYDPELFRRIRRLVRAGRWHIAGGGYVQPDLNVPSGESHIRQFLVGKNQFREMFGVEPTTAYNFDPFGQPEGYPRILAGCGFDSYIFCRPAQTQWSLPVGCFRWRDRSGAEVLARRSDGYYLTAQTAYAHLEKWLDHYRDEPETLILWGLGNHGGGPSREELSQIDRFAREHAGYRLVHSTPERFFRAMRRRALPWPVVTGEIQNCFPGCYTSMSRVKRAHRLCENLMTATERMAAMAWWLGKADYPAKDLDVAWKDILFSEFHDILPGTATQPGEKDSLMCLDHAAEILRRLKAGTFVRLLAGEKPAGEEVTPLFVWNPHSFPVSADVECDYSYSHLSHETCGGIRVSIRDGRTGRRLPFQEERTHSPVSWDCRVRVVVPMKLEPFQIRRIEATWEVRKKPKPWRFPAGAKPYATLRSRSLRVEINTKTGLLEFAGPAGERASFLGRNALKPTVWEDLDHAWQCGDPSGRKPSDPKGLMSLPWKRIRGTFRLATPQEADAITSPPSGKPHSRRKSGTAPVRVVEYGPVRTIIEAVFVMGASTLIRTYVLPKNQEWLEVRDRVYWNERDAILKVALPLGFRAANTISETPYSAVVRPVPASHFEQVHQRWLAAAEGQGNSGQSARYVAVVNDAFHGSSLWKNTLYLSLLRSPAYNSQNLRQTSDAHERRYWPRQDQGEHGIRYRILFGRDFSETRISRAAQAFNVPPEWMIFYPGGSKSDSVSGGEPLLSVTPARVQVAALKKQEKGNGLIIRLWEQSGRPVRATLRVRGAAGEVRTRMDAYGLKTFRLSRQNGKLAARETNLIERPIATH